MTYRVTLAPLTTSDATSTTYYQKFSPTNSMILRAIRTSIVQVDDPSYTSVNLKIYSNNAGSPRALIATSTNSPTKSELFSTHNSGVANLGFLFDYISLKGGDTYHAVLNVAGYTGTTSSFIGWKHSYPSPVYQTSVNMTYEGRLLSPFEIILIGAEL